MLASVPRSGSTWLRTLLEYSTNISTEVCCWGEGGNFSERTRSFGSCQPIEWANGYRATPTAATCGRLRRSGPKEPVVVKTHYPFHKPGKHLAPAATNRGCTSTPY